jgi:hypothetical protein
MTALPRIIGIKAQTRNACKPYSLLPDKPDRTTAERIQNSIRAMDFLLFMATPNSVISRWCPWELGYANWCKPISSIWIIPTSADGNDYGNEYPNLYRRLDFSTDGQLGVWDPGQSQGGKVLKSF